MTSGEGFIKAAGGEEIPNAGAEPQRSRQRFPAASCPRPPRRRDAVVPPPLRPGPALHRPGPRHRLGRPLGPSAPAVPAEIPGCRRREAGESPPRRGGHPAGDPDSPTAQPRFSSCFPSPAPLHPPWQTPYFPLRRPLCFPAVHPGTLIVFPLFLTKPPRCPCSRSQAACCSPRFPDRPLVPCQRWAMVAGWLGVGWGDPPSPPSLWGTRSGRCPHRGHSPWRSSPRLLRGAEPRQQPRCSRKVSSAMQGGSQGLEGGEKRSPSERVPQLSCFPKNLPHAASAASSLSSSGRDGVAGRCSGELLPCPAIPSAHQVDDGALLLYFIATAASGQLLVGLSCWGDAAPRLLRSCAAVLGAEQGHRASPR